MTEAKSLTTNLILQIGMDAIELIKRYHISVEDLFVLLALDEGKIELLDAYDSNNKDERVLLRYQYLLRRGFLEETEKNNSVIYYLTEAAKEILYYVRCGYKDLTELKRPVPVRNQKNELLVSNLNLDEQFELLWKSYPANSKNDKFPATRTQYRILRDSSLKAKENFKKVIKEGKYSLEDMLTALEYEVKVRKSNTRQNDLEFMPAITSWLNQQKFVGWLEESKSNPDADVNPFESIV